MNDTAGSDWTLMGGAKAQGRPDAWKTIPRPLLAPAKQTGRTEVASASADDPEGANYEADEALIEAANAAIRLGQPLLLTGEPGSGKTAFADHVAWQLGLGRALRFQIRSDMTARELLYRYDDLARFRAAHERRGEDSFKPETFLHLAALGRAIVLAADPDRAADLRRRLAPDIGDTPIRSVVLIDEIDKAPRDVPNDILGFLTADRMWFDVPELGGRTDHLEIEADPDYQPIVICTSNSERSLPDAFLRRCLFHEIAFPDEARLRSIVYRRAEKYPKDCELLKSVAREIERVRADCPATMKKPGLAEVLSFVLALKARGFEAADRLDSPNARPWRDLARMTLLKQKEAQDSVYPLEAGRAGARG